MCFYREPKVLPAVCGAPNNVHTLAINGKYPKITLDPIEMLAQVLSNVLEATGRE